MSVYIHPAAVRERFRRFAADDFDESRLAEGALLIAQEDYPSMKIEEYLERLDAIASRITAMPVGGDADRLELIRAVLFEEMGLEGNQDEYYDPRNSYLNEVLDRGLGIPISLSVVLIHVARSAGIEAYGVGLPGHYVVRAELDGNTVWVDAFNGGAQMSGEDLRKVVSARAGSLAERHLRPWTARETLMRMLANLHNVYSRSGDAKRARAARERIDLLAAGTVVN